MFTGTSQSIPAIQYLYQSNKLACVVLADAVQNPDLAQLQFWLLQNNIEAVSYCKKDDTNLIAKLDILSVNRGLVYMFRHKFRARLIQYFAGYLMNIHPSPLPAYRGPSPLYWQLRNGEVASKITLHQVTEVIGCGNIVTQVDIPIHPFDTITYLQQKVSQALPQLIDRLEQQQELQLMNQPKVVQNTAPIVGQQHLIISWHKQHTKNIVDMARAGNGDYGGAIFTVGQDIFRLLQASNVNCEIAGIQPGTVVELDRNRGLIIKTIDGAIRLDVIATQRGLFDGYRFAVLFGLDAGFSLIQSSSHQIQ